MREIFRYTVAAATAALLTGALGAAQAQDAQQAAKTVKLDADRTFLMTAGEGGHAEVVLARLAAKKAANDEVKKLAQTLERDHSAGNEELKSLATAKNVIVSTTLDPEHQQLHDRLEKLEGAGFDRAYATAMVDGHKKMITLYESASVSKDAAIKAYADKTLPRLRSHLKQAQQAQAAAGGATSTSGAPPANAPDASPK
jgi:putative membrane protein